MSTFNVKSTMIANRDAAPKVLTDPIVGTGSLRGVVGVEQIPQTAAAGSTVRLLTVPSSGRLQDLRYASAALGTSVIDIAAFYPTVIPQGANITGTAGAVISSSIFAANLAGIDTQVAWTDAMGLPTVLSIPKRSQPLWQVIGLTTDPGIDLDLGFTVRTANAIAGYVGLTASYID